MQEGRWGERGQQVSSPEVGTALEAAHHPLLVSLGPKELQTQASRPWSQADFSWNLDPLQAGGLERAVTSQSLSFPCCKVGTGSGTHNMGKDGRRSSSGVITGREAGLSLDLPCCGQLPIFSETQFPHL